MYAYSRAEIRSRGFIGIAADLVEHDLGVVGWRSKLVLGSAYPYLGYLLRMRISSFYMETEHCYIDNR